MTWWVLRHRPAAGIAGSVFAHPLFAEHVAFLQRLEERGWLVAAGPLPDHEGEGMTVVRLPDGTDAVPLATVEDRSVADGLFDVEVQRWDVRFTG